MLVFFSSAVKMWYMEESSELSRGHKRRAELDEEVDELRVRQ